MRRSILLSHDALVQNLRALESHVERAAAIDVRADAYGHGADVVSDAARAAGLRVDATGAEADAAATALVYGIAPGSRPVMTVQGEVVATKRLPAGSAVSYGYTYRIECDTTVALVGLGYADGIPRRASSTAHVLIGGVPRLVAGRIAMDQLMADLGDDDAAPGDPVVLWGASPAPSAGDWAAATGIPPLALATGLGARFTRRWTDA